MGVFGASLFLLHNSRAYFGRLDFIFPGMVNVTVGLGKLVLVGNGVGLISILNPVHWEMQVIG